MPAKLQPRRLVVAILLFVGLWAFIIVAFAAQLVFRASFEWSQAIRSSAVDWLPWVLLSPIVWQVARHFPLERGRLRWSVPVQIATCAAAVTLCGWMSNLLTPPPGPVGPGPGPRGEMRRLERPGLLPPAPGEPGSPGPGRGRGAAAQQRRFWAAVVLTRSRINLPVYLLIVSVAHAFAFYRRGEERARRELELTAGLSQAKLQALQLQLQPHFLFNTLNAVATLVHSNPDAADEMIANLAELLRLSLDTTGSEVPLRRELDLLDRYLAIEQVRLGDRLRVARAVEPGALDAAVPPLLLQTLAENAIRHGLEPRSAPGTVTIRATREGDRLQLVVADDGVGLATVDRRTERRGIGLANTEARLRELYGPAGRVLLHAPAEGGVRVEIEIPFRIAPVVPAPPPLVSPA